MKKSYKNDKTFILFLLIISVFFYFNVNCKSFNNLKHSLNNDKKFPEPKRNPDMNYVPCCCFTKLGYFGWYNEIPKNVNEYCNKYFSCLDDSLIGNCPDVEKSNNF